MWILITLTNHTQGFSTEYKYFNSPRKSSNDEIILFCTIYIDVEQQVYFDNNSYLEIRSCKTLLLLLRVMESNTITWLSLAITLMLTSAEGERVREIYFLFLFFPGKVFSRCEFARELVNKQGFARATVGHWVCLANVKY